jgi:transposase
VSTDARTTHDELTRLRQENERLCALIHQSAQEVDLLRAERQQLLEQQHQHTRTIEQLQHQLQQLLRRIYGRSSEKVDPKQMLLFETLLEQLAPEMPAAEPTPSTASESSSPANRGHGRRRLPSDLPRRTVIHDLPDEEKPCPCCGEMRHVIGRETSEQLELIPAKLTVIEHVRLKYACRACEQKAAEGGPQITTAEKPLSPIEKGLAAPGLLSYVIVSKYGDHLPLHRLERILQRHGIQIARSTLCDWAAQCAGLLRPLHDLMIGRVLGSKVIHTDDTPVDVLDRGLNQARTGRFWVYLGDQGHPYTVFTYTPSRSRDGPMEFLKGWGREERVFLQADAFGGYDGIYAGQAGGKVTEVACWAHARRKFYEARNSDAEASTQALAYIRLLYDVEDLAKESAKQKEIDLASERYRLRQELAVPRLQQFKTWLESQQVQHGGPVLPKSPMGQAILYALNQWDALCVYTTDGDLSIDNNASENALRRVAVGRKNWLFCGSDNGGNTAAILFSLIATCQRHRVDPLAYLRDVLTRIAATPVTQLDQFLPDQWKASQAATTPAN